MRPLEGVTVLDLTRLIPGPFCSWLLRSWGARVVKVEDTGAGDYLREAQAVWFAHLNAGAESIALDLKHPRAREAFLRLAEKADIMLEGFRAGVLERLGLDYGTLREVNPRLVLVSISGFGSDSELAGRAGHDLTFLARSGLLSLMRDIPPVQMADLTAGYASAAGALAALLSARATGRGIHVETPLQDAVATLGLMLAAQTLAGDEPRRESLMLGGAMPCYHVYETADGGRMALGALEPKFWRAFCEAVGHPKWANDQFDPHLIPEVKRLFRSRKLSEWQVVAALGDFCLEPVVSMGEAARRPGSTDQPVRFGGQRPISAGAVPERGEHTAEILQAIGISRQEIEAMLAEGLIGART